MGQIHEVGLVDRPRGQRHPVQQLAKMFKRRCAFAFYVKASPAGVLARFRLVDGDGTLHLDAWSVTDERGYLVSPDAPQLHAGTPYALVVELEPGPGMVRVALPAWPAPALSSGRSGP